MEKFSCFIGPYRFKIMNVGDEFTKAIVKHEPPHMDGAILEDMGQHARVIRLRGYFFRDTYLLHIDLIKYLEKREYVELEHPSYGIIQGSIESVSVRHDDTKRTAEVDVTFVETREETPARYEDIEGVSEDHFENGVSEQTAEFKDDLRDTVGADALEKELDTSKGIIEQFSELTGKAREAVKAIDSAVNKLEATLAEIANPANSLIATIEFATDLPGRVTGSITRTVERYIESFKSLKGAPEAFLRNFRNGVDGLINTLDLGESGGGSTVDAARDAANAVLAKQILVAGARMAGLELGYIFSEDEANRDRARKAERTPVFDVAGNYINPAPYPTLLSVADVEKSLAAVREYLQAAVDQARGMPSLKGQARSLMRHVNQIKLEKDKIQKVDVDNPMPLHLFVHRYGLPYSFAPRVLAINPGITHPSFAAGEVSVYAR